MEEPEKWWKKPPAGGTLGVTDLLKFKMGKWLDDATSDDYLQHVLSLRAFQHSNFIHNNTPNENGKTPHFLFHGKPSPSLAQLPVFGTDTTIKVRTKNSQGRVKEEIKKGVYLGVETDDHANYEIWTSFTKPCHEMETVKGSTVISSGGYTCMQAAEKEVRKLIRSGVSPMEYAKANHPARDPEEEEEEAAESEFEDGQDMNEWLYNSLKDKLPGLVRHSELKEYASEERLKYIRSKLEAAANAGDQKAVRELREIRNLTAEQVEARYRAEGFTGESEDDEPFDWEKKPSDEDANLEEFNVRIADESWGKSPSLVARCKAACPVLAKELRKWRREQSSRRPELAVGDPDIEEAILSCFELSTPLLKVLEEGITPLREVYTCVSLFETLLQDAVSPYTPRKPNFGPEVFGSLKSFLWSVRVLKGLLEELRDSPSGFVVSDDFGTGQTCSGSAPGGAKKSSSKKKKKKKKKKTKTAEATGDEQRILIPTVQVKQEEPSSVQENSSSRSDSPNGAELTIEKMSKHEFSMDIGSSHSSNVGVHSVEEYTGHIQDAFAKCLTKKVDLQIDLTDPGKHVGELAKKAADEFFKMSPDESASGVSCEGVLDWLFLVIQPEHLMMFVAASNIAIFKEYYPFFEPFYLHFNYESRKMAGEILEKYPSLKSNRDLEKHSKEDLGHVLGVLWSFFDEKAWDGPDDVHIDEILLYYMVKQWKGTSLKALDLIIDLAEAFERKYGDYSFFAEPSPESFLKLFSGFPPSVSENIDDWMDRYLRFYEFAPLPMIENFRDEFWPAIPPQKRERIRNVESVPEQIYKKFHTQIEKSSCADGFWSLQIEEHLGCSPEASVESPHSDLSNSSSVEENLSQETTQVTTTSSAPEQSETPSNSTTESSSDRTETAHVEPRLSSSSELTAKNGNSSESVKRAPTAEEKYASKMRELLMKHPELCPNCLEGHALSECTNIKPDSRDNPAAYIITDYVEQTKSSRLPFLEQCAERVMKASQLEIQKKKEKKYKRTKPSKNSKTSTRDKTSKPT
ncbi:hypothetical protein OXX80_002082 [Metschnikowia pulcherrima]